MSDEARTPRVEAEGEGARKVLRKCLDADPALAALGLSFWRSDERPDELVSVMTITGDVTFQVAELLVRRRGVVAETVKERVRTSLLKIQIQVENRLARIEGVCRQEGGDGMAQ